MLFYTLINKEPGKNSITDKDYDIIGKMPNELKGIYNIINKIEKNNSCAQDKSLNSTEENSSIIQSKEESLNQSNINNNGNSNRLLPNDNGISFNSSINKGKDQYIQNGNTYYNSNELTAIHSRIIKENKNVNGISVNPIDEENPDYNLSKYEKLISAHDGPCKFLF